MGSQQARFISTALCDRLVLHSATAELAADVYCPPMTHGSGCNMEEPQLQRRAPTSPRRRPSQPAAAAKMRRAISSEASGEATSSRQTMLHALTRFLRSTRRQSQPQDRPTRDHHRSKNANRSRSGRACSKASEQDEIPHGSQLGVRPPAVHPLPVTIVSDMGHVRSRIWENSLTRERCPSG